MFENSTKWSVFKKITKNGQKILKFLQTSVKFLSEQQLNISNHLDFRKLF